MMTASAAIAAVVGIVHCCSICINFTVQSCPHYLMGNRNAHTHIHTALKRTHMLEQRSLRWMLIVENVRSIKKKTSVDVCLCLCVNTTSKYAVCEWNQWKWLPSMLTLEQSFQLSEVITYAFNIMKSHSISFIHLLNWHYQRKFTTWYICVGNGPIKSNKQGGKLLLITIR